MAKPRTYRNMAAKWWKDPTAYPPEWKQPCAGQGDLLDELDSLAGNPADPDVSGGGSSATEKWLDETSVL